MRLGSIKKILILIFFLLKCNNTYSENNFKIIASVNHQAITLVDLDKEIEILKFLNNQKDFKNQSLYNIALNNIIDEKIKKQRIELEKIEIDEIEINNFLKNIIQNKEINNDKIKLIKEKILIDSSWNKFILNKFGWKISINMKEIDEIISKKKHDFKSLEEKNLFKEKLIKIEKNKKINVYSNFYFNKIKSETLINIY